MNQRIYLRCLGFSLSVCTLLAPLAPTFAARPAPAHAAIQKNHAAHQTQVQHTKQVKHKTLTHVAIARPVVSAPLPAPILPMPNAVFETNQTQVQNPVLADELEVNTPLAASAGFVGAVSSVPEPAVPSLQTILDDPERIIMLILDRSALQALFSSSEELNDANTSSTAATFSATSVSTRRHKVVTRKKKITKKASRKVVALDAAAANQLLASLQNQGWTLASTPRTKTAKHARVKTASTSLHKTRKTTHKKKAARVAGSGNQAASTVIHKKRTKKTRTSAAGQMDVSSLGPTMPAASWAPVDPNAPGTLDLTDTNEDTSNQDPSSLDPLADDSAQDPAIDTSVDPVSASMNPNIFLIPIDLNTDPAPAALAPDQISTSFMPSAHVSTNHRTSTKARKPRITHVAPQTNARHLSRVAANNLPVIRRDEVIRITEIAQTPQTFSMPKSSAALSKPNIKKRRPPVAQTVSANTTPTGIGWRASSTDAVPVRLTGIVASVPGLLSGSSFVLETQDGRGLLVHPNRQQTAPTYGDRIEITGNLTMDAKGVSLRMKKNDHWSVLARQIPIQPRIVNLIAPGQEDAWSLVNVTGTVKTVRGTLLHLEANGVPFDVGLKPGLGLRSGNLKNRDVIRVQGLVDISKNPPRILPRSPQDLIIVAPAPIQTAQAKKPVPVSPWMPFGVIGATVAVGQGIKKIKRVREHQRVHNLLAAAQAETESHENV